MVGHVFQWYILMAQVHLVFILFFISNKIGVLVGPIYTLTTFICLLSRKICLHI